MKIFKFLKYFLEFIIIMFLFLIFKIIGLKKSILFSGKIFEVFGPFFRSSKIIKNNLKNAFPNIEEKVLKKYEKDMWNYYGKIFAEYPFLKKLRQNKERNIQIIGQNVLDKIKIEKKPVVFISGHFDNFELMAMYLEKSGINLSAIYRPLNNYLMNVIMEKIRKKYICKYQIKKGKAGLRDCLRLFNDGYSMAIMIDQRVSEGTKINFFKKEAFTTTIPAQFIKKFNCKIIPIYVERNKDINFQIQICEPLEIKNDLSIDEISYKLNLWLENQILKNPAKWIWSHSRWK